MRTRLTGLIQVLLKGHNSKKSKSDNNLLGICQSTLDTGGSNEILFKSKQKFLIICMDKINRISQHDLSKGS